MKTSHWLASSLLLTTACSSGPPATVDDAHVEGAATVSKTSAPSANGIVNTDRGIIQGIADATTPSAWAFLGVPYAAPPTGTLRWQPPQPHATWSGTRATNQFGNECVQMKYDGSNSIGWPEGDEDCLTLNVWLPKAASTSARPVLFFLHGGGNVVGDVDQGRGTTPLYDGAALAEQTNSIVVTANYRLGPFGFVATSAFAAESPHHASGNYGMLDQQAALGWVQTNIAHFGGDPSKVLLFGQSAGALDSCALVASPLSTGLFSAALMESGACAAQDTQTAYGNGDSFIATLDCDKGSPALTAACLRNLDAYALVQHFDEHVDITSAGANQFALNVDGWSLPQSPLDLLNSGKQQRVPLVIGSNTSETGKTVYESYPVPMGTTVYEGLIDELVQQVVAASSHKLVPLQVRNGILGAYPEVSGDNRPGWIAITTDQKFTCNARSAVRAALQGQKSGRWQKPLYRYEYEHTLDGTLASSGTLPDFLGKAGAFHGQELMPLFHDFNLDPDTATAGYNPSADEWQLADLLDGYWSRFAATGNPNGGGAFAWPQYLDANADTTLFLDVKPSVVTQPRQAQCDLWDSFK